MVSLVCLFGYYLRLTYHSSAFGHKRAAFKHATSCYDTQLDHGRMHVSLIWPSDELPFRTCLFNIPTTHPPLGESWTLQHSTGRHNIPLLEATKRRLLRQFGGEAPGILFCCDTCPFHTTVFHLLLPPNKPGCTRLPSQRSGLAVLIVPLYSSLHIKLIYTFTTFPIWLISFIVSSLKVRRLDGVARRISCTFRIVRWFGDARKDLFGFNSMYDPVLVCEGWVRSQIVAIVFHVTPPALAEEHVNAGDTLDTSIT